MCPNCFSILLEQFCPKKPVFAASLRRFEVLKARVALLVPERKRSYNHSLVQDETDGFRENGDSDDDSDDIGDIGFDDATIDDGDAAYQPRIWTNDLSCDQMKYLKRQPALAASHR